MQQCAGTVKKLSLELGGNAPFIVFDDADIEAAVKGAIASKYRNAGQTCVRANRILVQDGVYDAFTERLAETAGAMKVADGFEPGAVIGPLIDMKAVEKVEAHIADASKRAPKSSSAASASRTGRQLLRADRVDRCDDRHGHHQGGDLRPGGCSNASGARRTQSRGAASPLSGWPAVPYRLPDLVRFAWLTLWAFLRITTNPRVIDRPLSTSEAETAISSWLAQPAAGILEPGERH